MDGTIKQSRRFAELERLSDDYFRYHLASVMDETRDYLARKQGEEMKEYSTSLGGVLSMMASSAQPLNDPYQLLKVTGEWNSKTTEDYVEMCKEKIAASEDIQHDLAYMAGQWRDAVVKEIGRERYDELSEQLGGDLAYAYMDYRLEQQMIDKLVKDRMPKSSADYIIRGRAGCGMAVGCLGRYRHAGRCRLMGGIRQIHRCGCCRLRHHGAFGAGRPQVDFSRTMYQPGCIRQRTQCV